MTADVKYGNDITYNKLDDWQKRSNPWTVTLKYQGRRMTVPFWTGQAITDDPTAKDVLECLLSDSESGDMDFEEFCSDLGYDSDSRTAERTWKQCQRINKRLHRLLGDDYETMLYGSNES